MLRFVLSIVSAAALAAAATESVKILKSGDFENVVAPTNSSRASARIPTAFKPEGPVTRLDYYVATDGSDENDGRTLDTPFGTIQKAASVMQAGDTCHIRTGTYRETVTPANSGQTGAPITFQPYQGEKVVLSGTDPITGWERDQGRVYKAAMPGDFFVSTMNQADQVFVNGRMMVLAQWPNTTLTVSEPAKAVCSKFVSKTEDKRRNMTTGVMLDDDLAPAENGYYVGADIFFQPNYGAWSWSFTGKVVGQDGTQLTFESRNNGGQDSKRHVYHDKSRYILYNLRKLLDAPGEWYHDRDAGWLYLRTPEDADPNTLTVEAKQRDYAFVLDDRAHVTIKGVELFACTITTDTAAGGDAVGWQEPEGTIRYPWRPRDSFAKSHHVVIDGIKARYVSHFTDREGHYFMQWGQGSGIVLSGLDHVLRGSVIQFSAGCGVSVLGARHRICHNRFTDIAYSGIDCSAVNFTGTAPAYDCEVASNVVRRTGRSGMQITGLKNSDPTQALIARVHHNDIGEFGMQDWDLGAIRAVGSGEFARIDHNWLHDAWPNVDNIPGVGNFTAGGVYLDYGSNWIVDHNVTWNVDWGCHLQASDNERQDGNILVYNNTFGVTPFGDPAPPYGPFGIWVNNPARTHPGSVVRNNIVYCENLNKHYKAIDTGKAWGAADNLEWDAVPGSPSDPKFFDKSTRDYRLSEGSPAIDAGGTMPTYVRDGVKIPPFNEAPDGKPDIGAYEFGQVAWRAGCGE